jgi:hypothetical protein
MSDASDCMTHSYFMDNTEYEKKTVQTIRDADFMEYFVGKGPSHSLEMGNLNVKMKNNN